MTLKIFRRFRHVRLTDDRGSSLVLVLGLGAVLSLVLVALSSYTLAGYGQTKRDVDWNTSVAAAQAGIDDYIARLNENELYWTQGASDLTNPALRQWTSVPGSGNGATFRYDVDTTSTPVDGLVRIKSSGKVDDEVRTVDATLRRGRFFDFVYFSDYETGDPANPLFYSDDYWDHRDEAAICGRYNWAGGYDSRNDECPKIYWRNDTIVGRYHTNDTFFVSGTPTFRGGRVSSGCPVVMITDACNRRNVWVPENSSANPNFESGQPTGGTILPLPTSNAAIRREADKGQGGRGCLYTGPTRIVFLANGKMAVNSPNTPATGQNCGVGAAVNRPVNGVIYVENLPANRTPADCSRPWVGTPAGVTLDSTSGGTSFPDDDDETSYNCRSGDVFVEGTLNGQMTVATQNNVIITGNLRYASGNAGMDVLGLIAENSVSLYHPIDDDGDEILSYTQMRDVEVWAAMLSVQHSFNVQNYNEGDLKGTMRVRGSIAQKWRGAVGTFSGSTSQTGYGKDWQYDERLAYLAPPKFLDPLSAGWLAIEQAEASPVHSP